MVRQVGTSARRAGRIHSQRPWMPGITMTGGPDPSSIISIPQRLPGLQRVRDAVLRLALAAQAQEGLTLQIQQLRLGHHTEIRQASPGENRRERAADERVVIADAARPPGQIDTELE